MLNSPSSCISFLWRPLLSSNKELSAALHFIIAVSLRSKAISRMERSRFNLRRQSSVVGSMIREQPVRERIIVQLSKESSSKQVPHPWRIFRLLSSSNLLPYKYIYTIATSQAAITFYTVDVSGAVHYSRIDLDIWNCLARVNATVCLLTIYSSSLGTLRPFRRHCIDKWLLNQESILHATKFSVEPFRE